jgi:hypothetical protein
MTKSKELPQHWMIPLYMISSQVEFFNASYTLKNQRFMRDFRLRQRIKCAFAGNGLKIRGMRLV